ncbi:hypothetical protein MHYP_G00216680 [Metynnis hypsauchen]
MEELIVPVAVWSGDIDAVAEALPLKVSVTVEQTWANYGPRATSGPLVRRSRGGPVVPLCVLRTSLNQTLLFCSSSSQASLLCLRQMSLSTRSQQHTVNTVTAQLPICTAV